MIFPRSYYKEYTSSFCKKIGQDLRGIIKYDFNNFGFINNLDYDVNEKNALCFFGSAITSSIGLPWKLSFPYQTAKHLISKKYKAYNFSQGCTFVDNAEIINTVEQIKNMKDFKPAAYVIQFIGLDRRFDPKKKIGNLNFNQKENLNTFIEVFNKLEKILSKEKWIFFGCDASDIDVPTEVRNHQNCLIWNPPFLDNLLRDLPGPKFHSMIAIGLKNKLKQLYNIQ